MSINSKTCSQIVALLVAGLFAITTFAQDDLRSSLFAQTDEALIAANQARASILAPKAYSEATKYYRSAEDKLKRGRGIDSIKKDLDAATKSFLLSVDATQLAGITLGSAIEARDDAEAANAAKFATEEWQDAEREFASAAGRLEDGNVNAARADAEDAESQYRAAELAAIKANYLDETRRLIAQAKRDKVDRLAPKTLAKAESMLASAEKALTENRYDTDEPRSIARQAKYEVKHAMYLARTLEPVRERDLSLEDFALSTEQPVVRISSTLDLVAEFDQGYDAPTEAATNRIEELQKDSYELSERLIQIAALETEIQGLEGQLGIQSARLEDQEEQRRKFRQVESYFGPGEAQILTQGQNILIRPVGLVFATGSAQIETQYFGLLRKVQDAILVYPGSKIVVEGHTDSFGGDESNLQLSEQRANAVRSYLLANAEGLSAADVEAVGFGEARPVANNETLDGRAKNRRIDLVIRPSN